METREISLTQGFVAIVDAEDYERLSHYKWRVLKSPYTKYAIRTTSRKVGMKDIFMHREILGLIHGDGKLVDHKDFDGLNNCKFNIRIGTKRDNAANSHRRRDSASKFKGVRRSRAIKERWEARIGTSNSGRFIGTFDTELEAALVYDAKAKELFGEFAKLNFPEK